MRLLSGNGHCKCHSRSVCAQKHRSLHLSHMHYLHGHCYGDRWIETFSAQELVWTLIQDTNKCRIFLYTAHATHFLALKRLDSLRAGFVIVREFEDRGRCALLCSALWRRTGVLWRSRSLLRSWIKNSNLESVIVALLFRRNWTCSVEQASA